MVMVKKRYILIILILSLGFMAYRVHAQTDVFTTSGVWTAPAGVTSVNVSAWGAGGSGASQSRPSGGGGGGYAGLTNFSVTPGNTYTVSVGIAGTSVTNAIGIAGGDSMFSASSTLLAKGGAGGIATTTVPSPSLGGQSSQEFGNTVFSGGNAGQGQGALSDVGGGGGGGGGGTANNGGNGTASLSGGTGGTGGATGGGNGGNGGGNLAGSPGSTKGGGGGGSGGTSLASGAGANGEVDITYTVSGSPQVQIRSGQMNLRSGNLILK